MFFSDRDKAIREMLRVMVPGGRGVVAVWDAIENAPAFATLVDLLDHVAGKPAGDALRAPFALGNQQMLTTVFNSAGADSVNLTTKGGTARFPTIREFIEAELRGWLPLMGIVLSEPQINRILADAERVFARYINADELEFNISAHIVAFKRPYTVEN